MLILDTTLNGVHWYDWQAGCVVAQGELAPQEISRPESILARIQQAEALIYVLLDGGEEFVRPVIRLEASHLSGLERCAALLPGPNEWTLALVRLGLAERPQVGQFLLCETALFSAMPEFVRTYPLPYACAQAGVRRFGGDGLVHAWAWEHARYMLSATAGLPALERLVSIHLGPAPSVAALYQGRGVESSQGFTALDGLPSYAGCGELDPSLTLYLLEAGLDPAAWQAALTWSSGWKALAGREIDWTELVTGADPAVQAAREVLLQKTVKWIGSCLAALGGAQALVFSAPDVNGVSAIFIGETLQRLAFLGIEIQPSRPLIPGWLLSASTSRWPVLALEETRLSTLMHAYNAA